MRAPLRLMRSTSAASSASLSGRNGGDSAPAMRNAGQRAFAADALALATRADADTLAGLRGDSYGYRVSDSAAGGSCAYQFVDLTEVVNPLPY